VLQSLEIKAEAAYCQVTFLTAPVDETSPARQPQPAGPPLAFEVEEMLRRFCLFPMLVLGMPTIVGGCAEGTKVEVGAAIGGKSNQGSGGTTTSTGSASFSKGGSNGVGGKTNLMTNGGGTTLSTQSASAGNATSQGGTMTNTSSGGTLSTFGGATATGGAAISTVAPPTDGLGIKMTAAQTVEGNKNIKTTMALVNQGSLAVDLLAVKIRYYFTIDSWMTPVLDTYYVGGGLAKENITIEFSTVALPGADRCIEMSFVPTTSVAMPSLKAGASVDLQTGLHDQSYLIADASNDYSFTGSMTGFTDRVTVYVGGTRVWGIEPGDSINLGAGGTSSLGAAGGPATPSAGASSVAGGPAVLSAGASSVAGSTSVDSSTAGAGAAGLWAQAGASGMESAGTASSQ